MMPKHTKTCEQFSNDNEPLFKSQNVKIYGYKLNVSMAYSSIPHFFPNTLKILLDMNLNPPEQVYLEPENSKASERP